MRKKNMLKMFNKISKSKWFVLGAVVLGLGLFGGVHYAHAADWSLTSIGKEAIFSVLGYVFQFLSWLVGRFLAVISWILFKVATYNNFVDNDVVLKGWPVVRDFCNMFFILILLVIGFATILRVENYGLKRLLPRLVIVAVLINFSKTICGLLIDFSQIIMLTLMSGLTNAQGNLMEAFGLSEVFQIANSQTGATAGDLAVEFLSLTGSLLLGLVLLIIATMVITVFTIILAFRIVFFWILIILSPLAFIASTLPGTSRYFNQWLGQFTSYLIVGPVMAFFLWLALATVGQPGSTANMYADLSGVPTTEGVAGGNQMSVALTKASMPDNIWKFIVSTCLLMGGLIAAQNLGVAGGRAAGSALSKIQGVGGKIARLPWTTTKKVAKGTAGMALTGIAKSKTVQNVLGAVGGKGGVLRPIASLATRGLVGLGAMERAEKEKAEKYIKNIRDTRILARIANQTAFTPWQSAVKKIAQSKSPSSIKNTAEIKKQVDSMDREELQKLSKQEWAELGRNQILIEADAIDYLKRNSGARGAYNDGLVDSGLAMPALGTPKPTAGNLFVAVYDQATHNIDDFGSINNQRNLRGGPGGVGSGRYKYHKVEEKETRMATEEEKTQPRGSGNLSINEIAWGQSNTLAVDYDKLKLESIKEKPTDEFKNIKGVSIDDAGEIKKIATRMVDIINEELNKIKIKPQKTVADEKRVGHLEAARDKFMKPEQFDHLNLVNSSAVGFKSMQDVKRTKIHEELHGFGVEDEKTTERLVQEMIDSRQTSRAGRKELGASYTPKTTDEIITQENISIVPEIQETNITKVIEKPEVKNIVNEISNINPTNNQAIENISYSIGKLSNEIRKSAGKINAVDSEILELADSIKSEKPTPLEVLYTQEEIKELPKQNYEL